VVSGYLFEKQGSGGRLVWRDRVVGRPGQNLVMGNLIGKKKGVITAESDFAIYDGAAGILRKFETRGKKLQSRYASHLLGATEGVETETFDTKCSVLWPALNGVIKNAGKYSAMQADDTDMMIIYAIGRGEEHELQRIDYAVLKGNESGCTIRVTETLKPSNCGSIAAKMGAAPGCRDAKDLLKRVHESLP
jgi:hypothetical protein